jgi:ABC-type glycerol-3-phosphate transport system substrate-binding protein
VVAAVVLVVGLMAAFQAPVVSQEPVTITVAGEAGGPYTQLHKDAAPEFTEATGIDVEYIEVPHDSMHQQFLTEALAGTGEIDVFQADQPWVAEFADAGYLEPLGTRLGEEDRSDFFPVALDTVSYDGELYALPYLVHNSVLYYRTDLFDEAGISEVPTTWDAYREVARQLTDSGSDLYGTMAEGKQSIEAAAKFLDVVQQAGGSVLDAEGNVVFDSQATIDAFNFLLGIQYEDQSSPPGAPGFDNPDTHNLFMQGKLAMAPNWPYMYGLASDPANSQVVGEYKVALQPGQDADKQSAQVFSWGYGINAASQHKDEAYAFVEWATDTDMLVRLGKAFTNPVPRASAGEAIQADPEVTAEQKDAIAVMTESVSVSDTIPSNPNWPAIHDRIGVALSKVMTQQATPEDEVAAAAADMRGILGQ